MTKILLAAIVAAFVVAYAVEMMQRRKGGWRLWLRKTAQDFKRGFLEGYRGELPGDSRTQQPALSA